MKTPEVKQHHLSKGQGIGGKVSSLNKKKEMPTPSKPVAGAKNKRFIPLSTFRRYYD